MKQISPKTPKVHKPLNLKKSKSQKVWENLQLLCLALTIFGQVTVGAVFLLGQGVWLASNLLSLVRDFALHRPAADKVKNAALTAITAGLIVGYFII